MKLSDVDFKDPEAIEQIDTARAIMTLEAFLAAKTGGLHVIYSDDDFQSILQSVAMLRESFDDVQYHELHDKDHYTLGSLGTVEFPKLLEVCTQP